MSTIISSISFGQFVEQIKRHISNGWPDIADNYTDNEILMYVYSSLAVAITTASNNDYNISGIFSTPEGFITSYQFAASTFTRDPLTGYFKVTLPQPPVNLPLGYSIQAPTFVGNQSESYPLMWIETYHRGYAKKLPTPNFGLYGFVQGQTLFIDSNGQDITHTGLTLNVPMLSPRSATGNDTDIINAPDDALEFVFKDVVDKITGRVARPQVLTNDGNNIPIGK